MNQIIVSTESTCDLDQETLNIYGIIQAPMHFIVDGIEYSSKDENMTANMLYEKMEQGSSASTSQINEFEATNFLLDLLKQGKDIVHISLSSALSGMCNVFKDVANKLNKTHKNKIYVIDSLCASLGQGLLAIKTCEFAKDFETTEELVSFMENYKMKINHLFTVDDLKYLKRSGRLSKFSAVVGSLLKIKPYLHCDNEGKLSVISKVISRKKSLLTIVENTLKNIKENENNVVYVAHANCLEDGEFVKNELSKKINIEIKVCNLGPIIGAHSGPGTIAVFFIADKRC